MGEPLSDEAKGPRHDPNDTGNPHAALIHAAFTRENLQRAFKRVRANKGAAGVDGLDIDQTARLLATTGRRSGSNCWQERTGPNRYGG